VGLCLAETEVKIYPVLGEQNEKEKETVVFRVSRRHVVVR
jgi:hypothetical protein